MDSNRVEVIDVTQAFLREFRTDVGRERPRFALLEGGLPRAPPGVDGHAPGAGAGVQKGEGLDGAPRAPPRAREVPDRTVHEGRRGPAGQLSAPGLRPADGRRSPRCNCPEVWTGTTWIVFCEVIDDRDRILADLEAAAAAGPEPRTWRCPTCHGPIVRVFREASAADVPSVHVPGEIEDEAVVRAGYRCRSAPCGWAGG